MSHRGYHMTHPTNSAISAVSASYQLNKMWLERHASLSCHVSYVTYGAIDFDRYIGGTSPHSDAILMPF